MTAYLIWELTLGVSTLLWIFRSRYAAEDFIDRQPKKPHTSYHIDEWEID
jgi:hypothetical protein